MKNHLQRKFRLLLVVPFLACLCSIAYAQINVNVQVSPPYQSRISEYASRPDLMHVMITNTSMQTHEVQLTATLEGDNGIRAHIQPGYRSPQPIVVSPGAVVTLSGFEIANLFSSDHVEYSGITYAELTRGIGLREGRYQLCVRALDYNTHEPLSPEQPIGCTSIVITNAEPPRILMPMNDQVVNAGGGEQQVFPLSWSTPPGSSPITQYKVKIVEVLDGRNPNDAMDAAPYPAFFEETVSTNSLVYGPAHPQLTPGRQYAMMVQAIDPQQAVFFRNEGKSEVIRFTYMQPAVDNETAEQTTASGLGRADFAKENATNTISGQFLWAFKAGEEQYTAPVGATPGMGTPPALATQQTTLVNDFLGFSPLQVANSTALAQQDPTLQPQALLGYVANLGTAEAAEGSKSPSELISANTASSLDYVYHTTNATPANNRYPLVNATVLIRGVNKAGNLSVSNTGSATIASGTTDDEGKFNIAFLHPDYAALADYDRMVLSVSAPGLERYEQEISIADLFGTKPIAIGQHTLTARTYRMVLRITGADGNTAAVRAGGARIRWLRKASTIDQYPYLRYEGDHQNTSAEEVSVHGRRYTTVATKDIPAGQTGSGPMTVGISKLFFQDELLVQIQPNADGFADHTATVRITDPYLAPSQVLEASLSYALELVSPQVGGEVLLQAGDQALPVKGAVVQVDFAREDVVAHAAEATVSIYTNPTLYYDTPGLEMAATSGSTPPVVMVSGNGTNAGAVVPELLPIAGGPTEEAAPPSYDGPYTVTTDSTGNFLVGDLPILREGASYSLKLLHVPAAYRDLPTIPEDRNISFTVSKGEVVRHSFHIQADAVQLVGRVVDADGRPVSTARLHFEGSGTYFETGASGLFQTSHYPGTHTLVIEKNGYLTREVPVKVEEQRHANPASEVSGNPVLIQESLASTTTVTHAVQAGYTVTPELFGWASSTSQTANASAAFQGVFESGINYNSEAAVGEDIQDLGDLGPLERRVGKVRFEVVDGETNTPLAGVAVQLFDTTHITNSDGRWDYEGFGGNTTVTFTPASGTPYYAIQRSVNIPESGTLTTVSIQLEEGVRVHGTVTSASTPVADATISVEGTTLFRSQTDESGSYEIMLPAGEHTVRAAKTGYIGDNETKELDQQTEIQLDFDLKSGDGKNISTLLGFEIELDEAVPSGDGEMWSGRFVNLQPAAELFADDKTHELAFSDVKVTFDTEGNAIPENNEVTTDETYLRFKLFGYLPVVMSDIDGKNKPIKVRQQQLGFGTIRGELSFDYRTIFGAGGIRFPDADELFIRFQDSIEVADYGLEIFRPDHASLATEVAFRLLKAQGDSVSVKLFGFDVNIDLTASRVTSQGLELSGTLYTPERGPVDAMAIGVESLRINKQFDVTEVLLASDDIPQLKIGYFSAQLSSVLFNENGFKLGGKLVTELPSMEASEIEFSNLRLANDALFGGEFTFPSQGIDVFQVATITPGDAPLSFGRVGNTSVYSVSGSAKIEFDKLFQNAIDIQSFAIRSDGEFDLMAATDFEASLPFAKMNIESVSVGYGAGNSPYVAVKGGLKLSVQMVELEASTITFRPGSGGGSTFSTGTIIGRVNAPIVTIGLKVGISDEGIEGGGELAIPGTEIGATVDFHYRKLAGGFDIGANFTTSAKIVLGVVEINELGGGFTYNSANSKFSGTIQGNASITGMSAAVSLEPVKLTVTDGPVVMGTADLVVAEKLDVAEAAITLDFREKFFSVAIKSQIEPLEGVASAMLQGLLRIKWAPQESYVFLGTSISVKMAGFANASGTYVLAVNVKNPKTRNDDLASYFALLDDETYGSGTATTFSGIYIHFAHNVGVPKNQAKSINLVVVQAKAWFNASAEAMLLLNFGANDYRFRLAGSLSAGVEGCVLSKLCIGAEFNACFAFEGGYNQPRGWFLSGKAAGEFAAHIGCRADCNKFGWAGPIPCGVRICVGAHASFNVSTRGQNNFSVGLGANADGNLCL
ncbi:carboxypeptidase regulatory-like domain-containing protein [Parapedobacter sp. 2B3]|uniref:carboxypeptidase regulatory-like domain-containing protein n=1 Tax=Parapedobacter sp. 2B3 TaxID=3342381 RepID=UPI0035B5943F